MILDFNYMIMVAKGVPNNDIIVKSMEILKKTKHNAVSHI